MDSEMDNDLDDKDKAVCRSITEDVVRLIASSDSMSKERFDRELWMLLLSGPDRKVILGRKEKA